MTYRASKGRTYGAELVKRMDPVSDKVLDRVKERRRLEVCIAKRWDKKIIAENVIQCGLLECQRNSREARHFVGIQWQRCRNKVTAFDAG